MKENRYDALVIIEDWFEVDENKEKNWMMEKWSNDVQM
jgi:hypothetical protein